MTQRKAPVALVLNDVVSYHLMVLEGIRSVLEPLGVPVMTQLLRIVGDGVPKTLGRTLRPGRVAGVVVFPCQSPSDLAGVLPLLAAAPELPRVYIGQADAAGIGSSVRSDNDAGIQELARHLVLDCGVRRILAVRGIPHHEDSADRERRLRAALAELGVALPEEQIVNGEFNREVAFRQVTQALQADRAYDAIVCFNDRSAIGAMDAAQGLGLTVPDDLMITGFDDDEFSPLINPPLTTVRQDLFGQGETAARLLLDMIDGAPPRDVRCPVLLVRRASTRVQAGPGTARAGAPPPAAPPPAALPSGVPDLREVARAGTPNTRERAWDFIWTHMTAMDIAIQVSRTLMASQSVPDLVDRLGWGLFRLEAARAFLVLRTDDPEPRGVLRLAFHDGQVQPLPDEEAFALEAILPARLAEHLERGWLMTQPLQSGDQELGYLLFDQPLGTGSLVTDSVGLDLSRALDAIRYTAQLADHAGRLEELVAERTRQLESELVTRRAAEERLSQSNADLQVQITNRQLAETELRRVNRELHSLLSVDGLTGVANRAAFDEALALHVAGCSRSGAPLSLVMIDVDRFKAYNDEYGHLAGDEALRNVAACLRSAVQRPADLAARYGGEEFALVLPNTSAPGAVGVAERVRATLAAHAIPHRWADGGRLTVSMGVVTVHPDAATVPSDLVAVADRRLYQAKHAGRDRIVAAPPSPADPTGLSRGS